MAEILSFSMHFSGFPRIKIILRRFPHWNNKILLVGAFIHCTLGDSPDLSESAQIASKVLQIDPLL